MFTIIVVIISLIVCGVFSAWLAEAKEYSGATWFFLGIFFGPIAFLAIGFAPKTENKSFGDIISRLDVVIKYYEGLEKAEQIKQEAIRQKEKELMEAEERKKTEERLGKITNLSDLLKDDKIRQQAEDLKRIYGQGTYEDFLERKAKELGITL